MMDAFWTKVAETLAAKGVVLREDAAAVRDPRHAGDAMVTDEQLRLLNETLQNGWIDAGLKHQWVENFAQVVDVLVAQGEAAPWPYATVFWLRLYGILVELRGWLRSIEDLVRSASEGQTAAPAAGSALDLAFRVARAADDLRAVLTDDELIYADYRRQTEAHPVQSAYRLQPRKQKPCLKETSRIPTLGREETVENLDAAIDRVLRRHSSEAAIACAFAARMQRATHALVSAYRQFRTPTR